MTSDGIDKKMIVTSKNFMDGNCLPIDQTCEGRNVSPHLAWGGAPSSRGKSFSIICDDPDAPSGTWVHWVIFNIPATLNELPEDVHAQGTLDSGARQGKNDFGTVGYGGACPPKGHGVHHYFFKVYALDVMLNLQSGISKSDLEQAMKGHVLAQGCLMGTYSRS